MERMSTFASGFSCLSWGRTSRPVCLGHDEVEQDHVGLQRARLEDGIAGVARLADRLDALLRLEQQPQAAADDGVVVDDEDPDAHPSGTSATIVVPAPGRDSISSRPSTKDEPLAHAEESHAFPAHGSLVEAGSVVLDHRCDRGPAPGDRDADVVRVRVLDDVRERLLHDPVERRLDLGRQPRLAERRMEVDANVRLLRERIGQPLERRHEAEVVEHGRAKLDREAADVLERAHDLLPQLGQGGAGRVVRERLLERLQPEQDRGQRLPRLVVELAREPLTLQLLRLHDAADAHPAPPAATARRPRRRGPRTSRPAGSRRG